MKTNLKMVLIVVAVALLCSCKVKYVELKETETVALQKNESGMVSKEIVTKPTINFDELFNETEESRDEELELLDESGETESATIEESQDESVAESETSISDVFDLVVENDDRVYHGEVAIDMENISWRYGMTPCEWVYIEPGIQLVSNYRPNTSALFSVNSKVSSGLKGCYIPVFTRTDMMSNDYDGRFYVFSDYQKETPDNMLFNNSLANIYYKGQSVEEILMRYMNLTKTSNGLLKNGDEYINIVYVTDLDKFIS